MLFLRAMLERVEVQCLVGDIKTKFMKVVIFKKQIFCSGFKCKSYESSRF